MKQLLFGIVALSVAPIASSEQTAVPARVLFVGNSLTARNDLPGMLQAIAAQAGASITCSAILRANFSLEDHWQESAALRALRVWQLALVFFATGPSSLPGIAGGSS